MSDRSSQVSADSISDSNGPDSTQAGSVSRTTTAPGSSTDTGQESLFTLTSPPSPPARSSRSMSSAEGSPARISPSLGKGQESTVPARVFGPSSLDSLGSYDPDTSSWRTFQLSFLEESGAFLETWPRSGMTRNGIVYRRQPLAPLTGGTASGLLPTPAARDWKDTGAPSEMRRKSPTLAALGFAGKLWPTPRASRNENRQTKPTPSQLAGEHGMNLSTAVNLWATPKASDADRGGRGDLLQQVRGNESPSGHFKTPTAAPFSHGGSGGELHKQVAPSGGPLNPTWVEVLMGFPPGWTDLTRAGE